MASVGNGYSVMGRSSPTRIPSARARGRRRFQDAGDDAVADQHDVGVGGLDGFVAHDLAARRGGTWLRAC